jgi:TonB family protein
MSVQKKCLTASAITHGLLVVLFFVGSAFAPQKHKPQPQMTPFELVNIPLDLVEEPNVLRGGGAARPPAVVREKLPPLIQNPEPQAVKNPEPPVKQPEPPKQELIKEEPVKPTPRPAESFDLTKAKSIKSDDKPKEDAPKFNFKEAKTKVVKVATQTSSRTETTNARDAERASRLAQLLESTRQTLAGTGTRIDIITEGGGESGSAQMSYDLAVAKYFEREFQRRPVPYRANEPAVEVEVVVRRDGSVTGRILKKSGRAQLDRTVQQVLDSTRKVIPFPEHFKSQTRTIKINFNLDDTTNG